MAKIAQLKVGEPEMDEDIEKELEEENEETEEGDTE